MLIADTAAATAAVKASWNIVASKEEVVEEVKVVVEVVVSVFRCFSYTWDSCVAASLTIRLKDDDMDKNK